MRRLFARTALLAVLGLGVFGLSVSATSPAQAGELRVEDAANVFTPEGIKKAQGEYPSSAGADLTVVTFAKVAADRRAEFEKVKGKPADRSRFFSEWATAEAKARKGTGVFVLISMEGAIVHALADREARERMGFSDRDVNALEDKIRAGFLAATRSKDAAESKRLRDEALLDATRYVATHLKAAETAAPQGNKSKSEPSQEPSSGLGGGIGGYLCIAVVIGLVIWLVIGLIRAMSGGGGMGGGGMGGGGFFPSLFGGLFGAMAGMWMYNQFFGGGSMFGDSAATDAGAGTDAAGGDTGAGDWAGGSDGGGADFGGGDLGGGDFGGGDFGGGDFGE